MPSQPSKESWSMSGSIAVTVSSSISASSLRVLGFFEVGDLVPVALALAPLELTFYF